MDNNRFKFIYVSLMSTMIFRYLSKINLILNLNSNFVQISSLTLLFVLMIVSIFAMFLGLIVLLRLTLKIELEVLWILSDNRVRIPSLSFNNRLKITSQAFNTYDYRHLTVMRC